MTKLLTATALTLALAFAAPAFAKGSQKFETSISISSASAVKVEVVIGEDLAYRANNLPKKLKDRGHGSLRSNSGFSNNGYYGEKDLARLAERLEKKMEKRLSKEGVATDNNSATVLRLVITDVAPNRPTFTQLSKEAGLSHKSYGIGGATFEGQLVGAKGQPLGDLSYAWYESNIQDAPYGSTWSDAYRAMDLFARKTAKSLKDET